MKGSLVRHKLSGKVGRTYHDKECPIPEKMFIYWEVEKFKFSETGSIVSKEEVVRIGYID